MRHLLVGLVLVAFHSAVVGQEKKDEGKTAAEVEKETIALINKERASQKLPAVRPNETLNKVAREFVQKLSTGKFDPNSRAAYDRVLALGYKYSTIVAPAAHTCGGAEDLFAMWKASPELFAKQTTHYGMSAVKMPDGHFYVFSLFATPSRR